MESRYKRFTQLIFNINKQIHKIKLEEMEKIGLKGAHVSCLFYLYTGEDGLTSADLAKLASEDKAAISRAVTDLEKMNYIEGHNDDNLKNYRKKLYLTELGRRTGDIIAEKVENMLNIGSQGLSEKDVENLYSSLTKISENLTYASKNYNKK